MQLVTTLSLALGLGLSCLPLTYGINIESRLLPRSTTPPWVATIQAELGPLLSSSAEILFPSSPSWGDANTRWSNYTRPEYAAIVEVGDGQDVVETVKYAAARNISFLAQNRGHGDTLTLDIIQSGLQINLRKLDTVTIDATSHTAVVQGGVRVQELIDTLYEAGFESVTGMCTCVGVLGPGLGGGHGRFQGLHGLETDQIVSAKIVLASGEMITVSETSHPDLYWGIRGAGANFGIVTEIVYKIYPLTNNGIWSGLAYIFNISQVEDVFTVFASYKDNQPADLFGGAVLQFAGNSSAEPTLEVGLEYAGPLSELVQYTAALANIGPIVTVNYTAPYNQLATYDTLGLSGPACAIDNIYRQQFPVNILKIDVPTVKAVVATWEKYGSQYPGLRSGTNMAWEWFPRQAVEAIPSNATAYAHRHAVYLTNMQMWYTDASLSEAATQWGNEVRALQQSTSGYKKLEAYLNYGRGDEPIESLYGWEPWRIERLKGLKRTYDPKGRFDGYHPLPR